MTIASTRLTVQQTSSCGVSVNKLSTDPFIHFPSRPDGDPNGLRKKRGIQLFPCIRFQSPLRLYTAPELRNYTQVFSRFPGLRTRTKPGKCKVDSYKWTTALAEVLLKTSVIIQCGSPDFNQIIEIGDQIR